MSNHGWCKFICWPFFLCNAKGSSVKCHFRWFIHHHGAPINLITMTIFCRKRFSAETESMRGKKGFVPLFDVFLYRIHSPHTKPINNITDWDPALFPFAPCDLIPPRVTWPIIPFLFSSLHSGHYGVLWLWHSCWIRHKNIYQCITFCSPPFCLNQTTV